MKRETFSRAAERVSLVSSRDEPQPVDQRPDHFCASPGCPMWGSISDQVTGVVRRRWCRFHIGVGGAREGEITRRLRMASELVLQEQKLRALAASDTTQTNLGARLKDVEKGLAARVWGSAA